LERPPHLQGVRREPVFQRIGGDRLLAVIDAILEGTPWSPPKDWGSTFLAFPTIQTWQIPTRGWHVDASYTSPLTPVRGVKVFALFGDVRERGGGTLMLSGSHRLIHHWFKHNPPPRRISGAQARTMLAEIPYIGDLHTSGTGEQRISRFMGSVEKVEGIPLQVVEACGAAGDVFLVHPLLLHVASPNSSSAPRFMLSGGVTTDLWGWDNTSRRST
jgi:ectoine hydroxylase-related dioxygenase (phytanoyl-CoA dioxygenase family)